MSAERDELAKAIYDGLHHEDSDVYADAIGGDLDDVIVDGRVDLLALAGMLLAAGYRKPRTVTTAAAELDALPVGSVELGAAGTAAKEALYGYTGDCNCHEAYTSRNRTDPSCWYHNVEGADEDILTAALPHIERAVIERLIWKYEAKAREGSIYIDGVRQRSMFDKTVVLLRAELGEGGGLG